MVTYGSGGKVVKEADILEVGRVEFEVLEK